MLREIADDWRKIREACLIGAASMIRPRALLENRRMWVAFLVPHVIVGCTFWAQLVFASSSALSPETWGEWACILPAKLWAAVMIAAALMELVGLIDPPRWRLIAAGAVLNAVQFQALALSAILSGGQTVIGAWPCALFVPAHILLAVEAWQYGRRK